MPTVRGRTLLRELAKNPPAGLSPVRLRLRDQALALLAAEELVEAAYCHRIVPLDRPAAETLHAGGEALYAPRLLPEAGELTALGCGVCTVGPHIETRITRLFAEKRASLALAVDEVANEMLFALGRRVQDRLFADCRRRNLAMAGELHAGDPGLDITAQAAVLRLAQADRIGVGVHGGHLLTPLKSTSVVFGVGIDLPEVTWSRCDACPSSAKCKFGRRTVVGVSDAVAA
ncbi:MAG: hypothetical protein HZC24_04825 [Rhodocyclales bacterium]|nr:hypothetical protein [Rhodocyclales bacterium]